MNALSSENRLPNPGSGKNKAKGGRRWLVSLFALLVVGSMIAVALFYLRAQEKHQLFSAFDRTVFLTQPSEGDVLPLHGTFAVSGEATSAQGISELQLIVNGQPWGSRKYGETPSYAQGVWQWTPSGEGTHELMLRAIDSTGQVIDSSVVAVVATVAADARLPIQYSTNTGDTLEGLAQTAGIGIQELLDANPDLDPQPALAPETVLTIPVHIPNADPVGPESGAPPAPPAQPFPDPQTDPSALIPVLFHVTGDPDFVIVDGKLVPGKSVDQLYLYASVDGQTPWQRIPGDPNTFLQPQAGGFDITAYIDLVQLENSATPHTLDLEAWGWQGSSLVALGSYHGTIGGGLKGWPPSDTQLQVITQVVSGKAQYAHEYNLVGENPSKTVDFDWTAKTPAFFVLWQVSTQPFSDSSSTSPPGLVQQELMFGGSQGQFSVDFSSYFKHVDDIFDQIKQMAQGLGSPFGNSSPLDKEPLDTFYDTLPMTFYVRLVALSNGSQKEGGVPSNTVVVHYLPSGETLVVTAPSGPIYEAKIVKFTPFRSKDPAYATCTVLTKDIPNPVNLPGLPNILSAGTQHCGCPGVSCGGGGSSCGWNPLCYVGKGLEAAGTWFVNAAGDLVNFGVTLYNDAKNFVIDTIADGLCPFAPGPESACRLAVNLGVNAGLAAMGLPPSLEVPNFDKLFNEGLDYALEYAVSEIAAQVTGFDCNEVCRDLLKKGFEGLSDPEQLYKGGLEYGLSVAANELGETCDATCQSLLKGSLPTNVNLSDLSDDALQQLADQAAQHLKDQGYSCDSACRDQIVNGLKQGASLGQTAANAHLEPPEPPTWAPHELSLDQPAIATIQIFRRFESASLDAATIQEGCGAFSLVNNAENHSWGPSLEGPVFDDALVKMPLLSPGESIQIPVILTNGHWYLPQGVSVNDLEGIPLSLLGYSTKSLGEEAGEPIGQVQQSFGDNWPVLYYGSQIELKTLGPYMLAEIDGQIQGFACFSEDSATFDIPTP